MSLSIRTTKTLNDGVKMPIFGLGLYQATPQETINNVKWAYEAGYRHFDTAQIYGNEADLGRALKELDVDRDEVFVTTKIWRDNGGTNTRPSLEKSLEKLGLKYVDLVLFHWPKQTTRLATWEEMVKLKEEGLTRSIGVSNYMKWHIDELLSHSSVVPSVNQIEFNPYLNLKELQEYCSTKGIQVESYSPLTKGQRLSDPKLLRLAEKYHKTPAQVLIRWVLEKEMIVIPKSSRRERIVENAQVFDWAIDTSDMEEMESWHENLVTGWNPQTQL